MAVDPTSAAGAANSAAVGRTRLADSYETFLNLLTAQIKNQDPLNPLDNAQVTTQLAQLNTVNGIEKLNQTLSQLLSGYNETQGMQAAGIIGKNVMTAGNALPLASGVAYGGGVLAGAADSVTLSIKNAAGKLVNTEELGAKEAGTFYFAWDGKDADGNQLPDGNYTFTVDAKSAGKTVEATAMKIGTVSAVTRSSSGFLLDLGTQGEVAFKDVQQIL